MPWPKNSRFAQDLEKENVRLVSESARLSSELALATAVLEAVGVIPKDVVVATAVATERRKVTTNRREY